MLLLLETFKIFEIFMKPNLLQERNSQFIEQFIHQHEFWSFNILVAFMPACQHQSGMLTFADAEENKTIALLYMIMDTYLY